MHSLLRGVIGWTWQRQAVALLLVVAVGGLAGCGGTSESDVRRYAMRRAPDPEEQPESDPSASSSVSPPAADAPASVSGPESPAPVATGEGAAESPWSADFTADSSPVPTAAIAPEPELPQTPEDCARRSLENMGRIAAAFETYRKQKGAYPHVSIRDQARTPLLSWRVELLPYLGYNDLYLQFDRNQPWYAPKNKALMSQIPKEYQSPERLGSADADRTRTNYLVPFGGDTIFQQVRTLPIRRIEDGLTNTVMLVEVDDSQAKPWTEPAEFRCSVDRPRHGLGSLRGGQVFVVWGGGTVGAVAMQSPADAFDAMFSADGGEPYTMASLNRPVNFAAPSRAQQAKAVSIAAASENEDALPVSKGNSRQSQPTTTTVAESDLAATYLAAATASLQTADSTSAWQWYYAALATGAPLPEYKWYPALRRPTFGLHFAVGLSCDGPVRPGSRSKSRSSLTRRSLVQATEPYGEGLLVLLEQHAASVSVSRILNAPAGRGSSAAARKSFDPAATFTVLAPGSEAELRQDVMAAGCDVLAMFVAETNSRRTSRTVQLTLIDMASRRELYSSPRLIYSPRQHERGEPGDQQGLKQATWKLEDLLADGLSPASWPVALNAPLASKRVSSLGSSRDPYPPRVIAEMLSYRQQRLVDDAQLVRAFESLLGKSEGTNLLLGNDRKRGRAMRTWLPADDPEQVVLLAERKNRSRQDD